MKFLTAAGLVMAAGLLQAAPSVSITSTATQTDGSVKVNYSLGGEAAIITVDVWANGASIGGEFVSGGRDGAGVTGDVNCRVETGGRSLTWRPSASWREKMLEGANVQIKVKAWPLNNTPDYMAVILAPMPSSVNADKRISYYPGAAFVPGGVLSNATYRTGTVLLRRIPAYNKTWKRRNARDVSKHSHDFYLGVFEVTCAQWELVYGTSVGHSRGTDAGYRQLMPMNNLSYCRIRESTDNTSNATYRYPKGPNPDSFMGKMRALTKCDAFKEGIDFDLPSEADHEFASWNNYTYPYWGTGDKNDGTTSANCPGRYYLNCQTEGIPLTSSVGGGPSICGCFKPTDWGLYDLYGNIREWCLDWWQATLPSDIGEKINVNATDSTQLLDGTAGQYRVLRGGSFGNHGTYCYMTSAHQISNSAAPIDGDSKAGFRLWCTAGLDAKNATATAEATSGSISVSGLGGTPTRKEATLDSRPLTAVDTIIEFIKLSQPGFILHFR